MPVVSTDAAGRPHGHHAFRTPAGTAISFDHGVPHNDGDVSVIVHRGARAMATYRHGVLVWRQVYDAATGRLLCTSEPAPPRAAAPTEEHFYAGGRLAARAWLRDGRFRDRGARPSVEHYDEDGALLFRGYGELGEARELAAPRESFAVVVQTRAGARFAAVFHSTETVLGVRERLARVCRYPPDAVRLVCEGSAARDIFPALTYFAPGARIHMTPKVGGGWWWYASAPVPADVCARADWAQELDAVPVPESK